jgi:hypothetical protein
VTNRYTLRRVLLLCGIVLLICLSSCASSTNIGSPEITPTPFTPTPVAQHLIDTWSNIHIFQTFDYNISNPSALANLYDFVWGAEAGHVSAFRAVNPNISMSFYIPFNRDWGTFPDSRTIHDLAYWQAVHPDWILYKCDRVTPAYTTNNPNIALDFTNPAVIAWQIQTYAIPASQNGYNAIAADNIILPNYYGACGVYKNGQWVQHYTGEVEDAQWRVDVINWLKQMQQALHSLEHPLALIVNFDPGNLPLSNFQVQQIARYSDGLLDEGGFTNFGRGHITDNNWVQRVQFMESVQEHQKPYYIIDDFPSVGSAEIQWALASYLMGKEHLSSVFITDNGNYGSFKWYSEYGAPIGTPLGAMYERQHVYLRNYSNGLSIVNPDAAGTFSVVLDAGKHYSDLDGHPVAQAVTLPPHSGLVLLLGS